MLPAERGLVSTGACVCAREHVCACMCVVCLYVCTCTCACCVCVHGRTCVCDRVCAWMHTCVCVVCVRGTRGEGVSKEESAIIPLFKGTPALPPGLPTRPHICRCPRVALEHEGSRDHWLASLLSAALLIFSCIAVPSPGRLHWEHVTLIQWRDFIPISSRPPRPPCVHTVGRRSPLGPGLQLSTGPGSGFSIEGNTP